MCVNRRHLIIFETTVVLLDEDFWQYRFSEDLHRTAKPTQILLARDNLAPVQFQKFEDQACIISCLLREVNTP